MENKIENLDQFESAMHSTSKNISKLVFAKQGNEVLSQLTLGNSNEFIGALVKEMQESENIAKIIIDAAKSFENGPQGEQYKERLTTLLDLEKCVRGLPNDARAFCIVDIHGSMLMYLNGNPIQIAASLCSAQENDTRIFDVLQLAAEGFNHGLAMGVVKSPENFKKG